MNAHGPSPGQKHGRWPGIFYFACRLTLYISVYNALVWTAVGLILSLASIELELLAMPIEIARLAYTTVALSTLSAIALIVCTFVFVHTNPFRNREYAGWSCLLLSPVAIALECVTLLTFQNLIRRVPELRGIARIFIYISAGFAITSGMIQLACVALYVILPTSWRVAPGYEPVVRHQKGPLSPSAAGMMTVEDLVSELNSSRLGPIARLHQDQVRLRRRRLEGTSTNTTRVFLIPSHREPVHFVRANPADNLTLSTSVIKRVPASVSRRTRNRELKKLVRCKLLA